MTIAAGWDRDRRRRRGERVGATEYLLLAMVILVPLVIAVAVTLWSLEQVRYRPKRARPRPPAPSAPAEPAKEPEGEPPRAT